MALGGDTDTTQQVSYVYLIDEGVDFAQVQWRDLTQISFTGSVADSAACCHSSLPAHDNHLWLASATF